MHLNSKKYLLKPSSTSPRPCALFYTRGSQGVLVHYELRTPFGNNGRQPWADVMMLAAKSGGEHSAPQTVRAKYAANRTAAGPPGLAALHLEEQAMEYEALRRELAERKAESQLEARRSLEAQNKVIRERLLSVDAVSVTHLSTEDEARRANREIWGEAERARLTRRKKNLEPAIYYPIFAAAVAVTRLAHRRCVARRRTTHEVQHDKGHEEHRAGGELRGEHRQPTVHKGSHTSAAGEQAERPAAERMPARGQCRSNSILTSTPAIEEAHFAVGESSPSSVVLAEPRRPVQQVPSALPDQLVPAPQRPVQQVPNSMPNALAICAEAPQSSAKGQPQSSAEGQPQSSAKGQPHAGGATQALGRYSAALAAAPVNGKGKGDGQHEVGRHRLPAVSPPTAAVLAFARAPSSTTAMMSMAEHHGPGAILATSGSSARVGSCARSPHAASRSRSPSPPVTEREHIAGPIVSRGGRVITVVCYRQLLQAQANREVAEQVRANTAVLTQRRAEAEKLEQLRRQARAQAHRRPDPRAAADAKATPVAGGKEDAKAVNPRIEPRTAQSLHRLQREGQHRKTAAALRLKQEQRAQLEIAKQQETQRSRNSVRQGSARQPSARHSSSAWPSSARPSSARPSSVGWAAGEPSPHPPSLTLVSSSWLSSRILHSRAEFRV